MECPICLMPCNTSSRTPKNLPCGHTYCAECLIKLLNDCLDCHEKPQDGPCLPEHCSKRLCSDCKSSHLKKFSVDLVAELQTMKEQITELQAKFDDDNDFTRMVDQSKTVIDEVSRVFDAEKEKMIDVIEKKQKISSHNYFQWKENFNLSLTGTRSVMAKALSEMKQVSECQSGKFLSDLKKQLTQEKEAISEVEGTKDQLPLFDASGVQKIFDEMMPALYESIMPLFSFSEYTAAGFSQSYGKEGSGEGEFNCPFGVASCPVTGNLAVSDRYNHRIHILTADLQPVRVFGEKGTGQNEFTHPEGVCFSSTGGLFIADNNNHRIKQVNEEEGQIRTFGCQGSGVGQFEYPCNIYWEGGLLYICEWKNWRIQVVKETGQHVRFIGSQGAAPGQFTSNPLFIAASGLLDRLVVSDYLGNLYFFSLDGEHRKTIRVGQPPYNIKAGGVMIDQLGQVIVSDREEGCLVVLGENKVITTIRLPAGERMGDPWGVTMTSEGSIIVCDHTKHQIHKFTVPRHKKSSTNA